LAEVLSVAGGGNHVWTYTSTSAQVLSSTQSAISNEFLQAGNNPDPNPKPTTKSTAAVGVTSTIGGDVTAWYSGYDADVITSVAVWYEVEEKVKTKTYVVQHSLGGLGGVSADNSVQWPENVWSTYVSAVTSGTSPILKPGHGRTFGTLPTSTQTAH
jgi:hypothetical protein